MYVPGAGLVVPWSGDWMVTVTFTAGKVELKLAVIVPGPLAIKVVELAVGFAMVTPPVVIQFLNR